MGRADPSPDAGPDPAAARAAIALGLLLSFGILLFHLDYHRHAAALWRDEVNSVNVASLPSAGEVLSHLQYDSFPPAWISLLYTWRIAGAAHDDAGYRRLGLTIGLTMIAVLWWTSWRLGLGPPLVALLLFGMSPSVIIYGDMVRGYGLAALAIVWASGAVWTFVQRPTAKSYILAQVATIVAAQTHFANGIPLLGLGVGAAAVCWRRRDLRLLVASLALGGVAAALLLAVNYRILGYMRNAGQQELHLAIGLDWLVKVFTSGLAPNVASLSVAWAAAALLASIGLAASIVVPQERLDGERAIYTTLTLAITLVGTLYAYQRTSIPTHYWHYLSVTAVSALACEVGVAALARRFRYGAWLRIAAVGAAAAASSWGVAEAVALRMTTVDLIAREIERTARRDDLVVVFPWVCGISFERYYRGPAPWITLPDLPDHRFHLHALVRERMELGEDGVAAELARVERTLRQGGRVWIVGSPVAPDPGVPLPPLGSPSDRGSAGRHLDRWEMQLGALLEQHAGGGRRVPLPATGAVNAWESLPLFVAEGWR